MATDTFSGEIYVKVRPQVDYLDGNRELEQHANHTIRKILGDGNGANQALGFFSGSFTATTGGITISLAELDPLGAAGDTAPSKSADGDKLRAILIENQDATNYVELEPGANPLGLWITGTSPVVRIPAGGFLLATFPSGLGTMDDGSDDEIKVTADTASCTVKLTYIFG